MKSETMLFIFPRAQAGFLIASCDAHEFSPKSTLLLRVHPCQGPTFMWEWGSDLALTSRVPKELLLSPHGHGSQAFRFPSCLASPFLSCD